MRYMIAPERWRDKRTLQAIERLAIHEDSVYSMRLRVALIIVSPILVGSSEHPRHLLHQHSGDTQSHDKFVKFVVLGQYKID